MARGDLSEAEWVVIGYLLPPERGRKVRPAHDNQVATDLHVVGQGQDGARGQLRTVVATPTFGSLTMV